MIRSHVLTPKLVLSSSFAFTLLGLGAAANATTLAAGGIFGGSAQNAVVCYIYNSGSTGVSIIQEAIIQQSVGPVPLTVNQCGASLAAGAICGIAANAINNAPYACKFDISPNTTAVRGEMELRSGLTVLKNLELR